MCQVVALRSGITNLTLNYKNGIISTTFIYAMANFTIIGGISLNKVVNRRNLCFIFIFLFYAFLMWCSPYSNDDYDFLSLKFGCFSDLMSFILEYGNGRFLGNLSSVVMVHFPLLSIVLRAMMISTIIGLIPYLLGFRSTFAYLASFILLTVLDPVLFGQVYLWSSGFYNYIPPVWMALVAIALIQKYPSCTSGFVRYAVCGILVMLGFCGQLYVEHSTIINLIIAASLLIHVSVMRKHQLLLPSLLWFLSVLAGTIVMFAIPVLFAPKGNRSEGYRSYNFGTISSLIVSCVKNGMWLTNYYSGINSLPICLGSIATLYLTRCRRSRRRNEILLIILVICGGVLLFSDFTSTNYWYGEPALLHHVLLTLFVLTEFVIWIIAVFKIDDSVIRYRVFYLLFLAFMSLAPLLIVSPMHMRVAFQSYLFFSAAAMLCISVINWNNIQLIHLRTVAATIVSICMAFNIVSTMVSVKIMSEIREAYILHKIEQNASEITIFGIPYDYIQWDGTWSFGYYFYRENKDDTVFTVINYDYWKNYYLPEFLDAISE